jgi:hypothetical protein
MLPDVALLEIFDSYVHEALTDAWYTLVHVCRKWRNIVFGSPRRLDLQLFCTASTPVKATLNVWPPLPIVIWVHSYEMWGVDNIIPALEQNDRLCIINLFDLPSSHLAKVLAAMQRPFPALTRLQLRPTDETETPVNPASFLGGSAPKLQTLILDRIPFPGLPKLLLSATHLVYLELWRIPLSGYISPEAMVTGLSVLTKLESLLIEFESPECRPDRKFRRPPPSTRTLLPALADLQFKGVCEYLEDLMAQIDTPLLDDLAITFFHQLVFDTPHFTQLITRTPKFKAHDEARVFFSDSDVSVTLPQTFDGELELVISCSQSDWQLSSLAQVCGTSFPRAVIAVVEHLYILKDGIYDWQEDIENRQWIELLLPFTSVKDLYISSDFTPYIVPALQELVGKGERAVLPALQTLFLEEPLPSGPIQEIIGQFVATRQFSGHPVAISRWEGNFSDSSSDS